MSLGLFFLTFSFLGVLNGSKVQAFSCGINTGNPHDYAGTIVNVVVQKTTGQVDANDVRVNISPKDVATTGAGNIYKLNSGSPGDRIVSGNFNQINGCDGTSDSRFVLGRGNTSQPDNGNTGEWAVDCDISKRGSGNPQKFTVTGIGIPSAVSNPATAQDITNGYGWQPITIDPANGNTQNRTLVYREPPPLPIEPGSGGNPGGGGTIYVSLRNTSDCQYVYGSAYYRPSSGPDQLVEYKLVKQSGGGPGFDTNWIPLASQDRYDSTNQLRLRVAIAGANYWGGPINTVKFKLFARQAGTTVEREVDISAPPGGCVDYTPVLNVSANCSSVRFGVTYDQNANDLGKSLPYTVTAHYYGTPTTEIVAATSGDAYDGAQAFLNVPPNRGGNSGWYYVVTLYNINHKGLLDGSKNVSYTTPGTGPCYSGELKDPGGVCTLRIASPLGGTTSGVEATKKFKVIGTLRNTGQRAFPTSQFASSYRNPDSSSHYWNGDPGQWQRFTAISDANGDGVVSPGESAAVEFELTAPNFISDLFIEFYPDYTYIPANSPGEFIGSVCRLTVHTYKPFSIEPKAELIRYLPDNNNPNKVQFPSSTITTAESDVVVTGVSVARGIIKNGPGPFVGTFGSVENLTGGTKEYLDELDIIRVLGDRYCGKITVVPAAGFVGPAGTSKIITVGSRTDGTGSCDPTPPPPPPGCLTPCCAPGACDPSIVNYPYVKAYGGDVVAGGGFTMVDGTCSAVSSSGIFAYMRPLNEQKPIPPAGQNSNKSGSGGQFGAFAWGKDVSGFTSVSQKTIYPPTVYGGNKLTFANTVSPPSMTSIEPILGGNLSSDAPCLPDYFTKDQLPAGNINRINGISPIINVSSLTTGKQTVFSSGLTINGSPDLTENFAASKTHTVIVDGNVTIKGNIVYNPGPYASASAIPNFKLIVRGNIYVDKAVTRLDGTYIAQPKYNAAGIKDPSSGKVYTCSDNSGPITDPTRMFNECGAATGAGQLRVNGSFIADKVILGRTLKDLTDSKFAEPLSTTQAAEVFTFYPDVYLSPSASRIKSSVNSGDYKYIVTLPPIL